MDIFITPTATPARGTVRLNSVSAPCALGARGIATAKTEGDSITPAGAWPVRRVWYRPDREPRPITLLDTRQIERKSGWCDDISAPEYNRLVGLPFAASHEILWRADGLYDVFLELGYNDDPPVPSKGSAIFLHLEKNDFQPTLGCVAVSRPMMGQILTHITPHSFVHIG